MTGAQIRQHRRARKWTQAQLAEAAGVSVRMIQDAESGKHTPQPENMRAIAAALEVEGVPEETRAAWPADVQVFLDIMGATLTAMSEADRAIQMRRIYAAMLGQK